LLTHQLLVYADDVNILGGNEHNIKKITDTLVVPSKEIGLKVNSGETKYLVMSLDQKAGRSHNMKNYDSSYARVEQFKYLGTFLMCQNSIQEEIKSRLK